VSSQVTSNITEDTPPPPSSTKLDHSPLKERRKTVSAASTMPLKLSPRATWRAKTTAQKPSWLASKTDAASENS